MKQWISFRKFPASWLGMMVIIFALTSLLLGGCSQMPFQAQETPTPTPLPTLAVQAKPTFQVTRGPISDILRFDGRVVPVLQKELFFKVNGRVRKVYVLEGDTVKAGQLLADLNVVDGLESGQASKQLTLRRAQIQVDIALNQLELFKLTTSKWMVGYAEQLAIKDASLELAKISLDEASMGVEDSSKAIADASIIAPIDGQLLSFRVQEGQSVEAYKAMATVANINDLEISAEPNSEVLAKILEGMQVSVTDVNDPVKTASGSIRRMPYISTTDTTANQVRIKLDVPMSQVGFRLSQRLQVSIVLRSKDNVLLLPPQAIRTFEGRSFVLVKNGNLQQRVDVKIGIKAEDQVEILDGLSEGQIIIAP
jgi:RND family efflux transporter MFP subunit